MIVHRPMFRCRVCGDVTDWVDRMNAPGMRDVCIWCGDRPAIEAGRPDPARDQNRCKRCGITAVWCAQLRQNKDQRCCSRCTHDV